MRSFPSESKKCGTGTNKSDQDRHDHDYQASVWKFSSISSISSVIYHNLGDSRSVKNVLSCFLTDEFLKIGAAKTNKCANQWFDSQAYKHKMYDENFCDTTEEEMKASFALHIIMTSVKKPTMEMNWSKRGIL